MPVENRPTSTSSFDTYVRKLKDWGKVEIGGGGEVKI
jgi:hypothetical protein